MKLSDALATLKGTEKTASAASSVTPVGSAPSNSIEDRLKLALKEATAPAPEKTASAASPTEDLTKIAADLSRSEHDALVKEAQLYGASVCDGFMARAAQYNAAADAQPAETAKTASEQGFEKFAAENPALVKEAAQLGYDSALGQLEKLAGAAYDQGWNTTVQQIHKLACDSFVAGFSVIHDMIEGAR